MVKYLVFTMVITAILSCGQSEPLTNYEPKSLQEQSLKSILLDFQGEVKIYMARGDFNSLVVFNMKLENNKWYIQNWKY